MPRIVSWPEIERLEKKGKWLRLLQERYIRLRAESIAAKNDSIRLAIAAERVLDEIAAESGE